MYPLRIFIGYDPRESLAYRVCIASLLAHSKAPFSVEPINMRLLGAAYRRPWEVGSYGTGGRAVLIDSISNAPMSTEFSLARFFVPYIAGFKGWALYIDCDFMFRAPVEELFELRDDAYAIQVVKHNYTPVETLKMDGQVQTAYARKNWSSMMLFNCEHPAQVKLCEAQSMTGMALHQLRFLNDPDIGPLPIEWNWLEGVYPCGAEGVRAKAVHFTRGTPDMPGYETSQHALEWREYAASRR